MIHANYFNYTLHERINRKSHFEGVQPFKIESLNSCAAKPEIYMPNSCLVMSGRRIMDGQAVIDKTRLIRVRIDFSNGVEPFRRKTIRDTQKLHSMKTELETKHAQALNEIEMLINSIMGKLKKHTKQFSENPKDWGYLGSINHVRDGLTEIDEFLGKP